MRIYQDIKEQAFSNPVVTLGIFDGVHLAHQSIIRRLNETARELSGESAIVTLWPHPRIVLNHNRDQIGLLNTLDEKIEQFQKTGVQNLIVIPFDEKLASMDFDQFLKDILIKKIGIIHMVVGYNHHFGRNREGNFDKLLSLSTQLGFGLSRQDPVIIDDNRISSSLIRRLIMEGELETANRYLGYIYHFTGIVVGGDMRGRDIGFPTANIKITDANKLIPPKGVYAVYIELNGIRYKGMMNIGCRPTFNDDCALDTLEVNLFDFSGDLYNKTLRIICIKKVRDEKKFETAAELTQQILHDKQLINKILDSVKMKI